jgi:hypothetical protein
MLTYAVRADLEKGIPNDALDYFEHEFHGEEQEWKRKRGAREGGSDFRGEGQEWKRKREGREGGSDFRGEGQEWKRKREGREGGRRA